MGERFGVWLLLYGFAGFLALSLEIVWFRLLGVILKSTAFTFGTLLSMYLTGIGAGAAAGSLVVRRSRSPSRTFLIVQAAIGVYVALAIAIIVALFGHAQAPGWLQEYVARYESLDVRASVRALVLYFRGSGDLPRQFLALYLVLPALLVGPPTVLMGVSFPLLQQAVQTDLARIGHRVGTLLAANIVGSTIGSLATGWILLGRLGTSGTLKLLIAASAIFPLVGDQLVAMPPDLNRARTRRVHDTFVKVFPHVLSYGDVVLGSQTPIVFDAAAIRRRLSDREVQAYYRQAGIDILSLLAPYLDRGPLIFDASHDRSTLVDINTDLHPKDEFALSLASEG